MDQPAIQAQLKRCGYSQADIARQCSVSEALVSRVICGERVNKRVAKAISAAAATPMSELWPDGYGSQKQKANRRSRKWKK